jgi:hypothetical protein
MWLLSAQIQPVRSVLREGESLAGCSKQVAIGNELNSITRQRFTGLRGS